MIADLKAKDEMFAADYDVEKKKKETQIQIQMHVHNQIKKSLIQSAGGYSNSLEVIIIVLVMSLSFFELYF
jgi:hypothetical protein